jgi:hypothetical protein
MTVKEACARLIDAHAQDCSGFARAVAAAIGVPLAGDADAIADLVASEADGWTRIPDGPAAAEAAATQFVLAVLRGDQQHKKDGHGHVVVIVPGPLANARYPSAFWGSLGGSPGRDQTINWSWTAEDRDKVIYGAHAIPA